MISDGTSADVSGSKPTKEVTARLRLLERLLATAPASPATPDFPAAPRQRHHLLRVMEWLIGALGLIALGGAGLLAIRAWTAVTPAPAGVMTLLGLAALLAAFASALALGGGRWDALLLRLCGRPARMIAARDRWMTLLGAMLLLAGAVAHLGAAASVQIESENKPTETR